jgi:ABC-type bacteriocin/lantibiotic exporter with double-glycine peptidase domain
MDILGWIIRSVYFPTAIPQKFAKIFYPVLLSKTEKSDFITLVLLWKCCSLPEREDAMPKFTYINNFISKNRYAFCCVLSAFASLLGFVNPVLSSFIVANIIKDFNLRGIVPILISMVIVKGTRMYLRSTVTSRLRGNTRAPLIWLQRRIGKRLWWIEPIVGSWGWVGMTIKRLTKLTGGVSIQIASFIVTTLSDTVNALAAGIVYYFTQSYVLSLLTALIIPSLAVVPWFAKKSLLIHRRAKLSLR